LELLFDNVTKHSVTLAKDADDGSPPTVGYLVRYLCDHLMKDSRKELFVLADAV
jgi:ubiquitin related modifier 1